VFLGGLWDEMYFFEINFLSLIVKTETCCSPGVGMRAIMIKQMLHHLAVNA